MDRSSVWSRLNWPHVALVGLVIAGTLGALGIVLAFTPPAMLEKLLELNWPAVVLGGVSLLIAVYGMLRRAGILHTEPVPGLAIEPLSAIDTGLDDEPTHPLGPRAIRRRDTPPGDRGSILAVLLAFSVAAGLGGLLTGCGASAIRINATANTVATVALEQAHRAVLAETDEAIAACPPAGSPDRAACLAAGEERIRPLGIAYDGFRLAVVAHREGVETAAIAGDSDIVRVTLARSWAIATREYDALLELLLAGGADVSFLMPLPEVE